MSKHTSERSKQRDTVAIIAAASAVVLIALALVISSLGSSGGGNGGAVTTESAGTSAAETTAAERDTVTETVATETETETETESESLSDTEVPVTTNPPFVPDTDYDYNGVAAGTANELSTLSNSVFIGDSRTEGLRLYTPLASSGARIYAGVGMMVNTILTENVVSDGGGKVTLTQALASDPDFDSVYIMLGINELGWAYTSIYVDNYAKIIDAVRSVNPDAKIYIQSLIPVTRELSDNDPVFRNSRIEEYNKALSELAAQKGVYYLNVAEIFSGDGGSLPPEAASDGVHLSKNYCNMWLDYILTHRV